MKSETMLAIKIGMPVEMYLGKGKFTCGKITSIQSGAIGVKWNDARRKPTTEYIGQFDYCENGKLFLTRD